MAQAAPRPTIRGPTFVRLLARLAGADVAPPTESLPDRLGQWLDWKQALVLADALDARPEPVLSAMPAPPHLPAECARAREALALAITADPLLAPGAPTGAEPDYAPYRQCCLTRQRAMQASAGRLRGQLREALTQAGPAMAHLAGVDAVMEAALAPREQALLATVPALLEKRFARLREAAPASSGWLDGFRRDLRSVLLAELDVRFHPIDALLAALPPS